MNVLIFVMSMLMLIAMMTYGRLESFRGFAFIQSQFKTYMEVTERQYVNEEAYKRYQETPATTQEQSENKGQEKNPASSKLSFNLFVDTAERNAHPQELEHHLAVARNLLYVLYGEQPFFNELAEKRPEFLNEIFSALMRATEAFAKKEKLKKAKEIATVDLEDAELNAVFTKMLKGTLDAPAADGEPVAGYPSLLDYITLQKNKLKIRVYLAAPPLLTALYGNPEFVRQIIDTRTSLYRDLVNEVLTKEQATQEFQTLYQNQQLPEVPSAMLDFGVSKTNPAQRH